MARKKNHKALFEVLSRGQGSMKVPDWAKKSVPAPGQPLPDDTDENPEDIATPEPVEAADAPKPESSLEETPQAVQEPAPVEEPIEEDAVEELDDLEDDLENEPEDIVEIDDEVEEAEVEDIEAEEIEDDEEPGEVDLDEDEIEDDEEIGEEELEPEDIEEVEEEVDDFEEEVEEDSAEPVEEQDAEELDDEYQEEDDLEEEEEISPEDYEADEEEEDLEEEVEADDEPEVLEADEVFEEEEVEEGFEQPEYLREVTEPAPAEKTGGGRYVAAAIGQKAKAWGAKSWTKATGPMFKIAGDRIRLSVNYVTAGVVLLIVFTLVLTAFVIGKKTGSPAEDGQSAASVGQEVADPGNKPSLPGTEEVISEVSDGPVEAMPGKRDPKRYYLIIETLKGATAEDYDDAEDIVNFCASRGLPAEMVKIKGRFAVWCLLGFRSRTSTAAIEHARQVERVGEEFFAKHRTYQFMQRNSRGGELIPFFKRGKYSR